MKKIIAIVGSAGVAAAGFALITPSASARTLNIGDGASAVLLAKCNNNGKPQSTPTLVPNCSYTSFLGKGANASKATFTYLSSDGNVTWTGGSVQAGNLTFPAAGQTWPAITGLPLGTVSKSTPSEITGTVDTQTGLVVLNLKVATRLTAGDGKICDITGSATLRSDATEPFGKVKGSNYDPATAKFAVAAPTPPAIQTSGNGCASLGLLYDTSKGMGYFITGQIGLPGGATPPPPGPDPTPTPEPTPTPTPTPGSKSKLPINRTGVKGSPASLDADGTAVLVKSIKTNKHGKLSIRGLCRPVGSAAAGEAGGCDVTVNAAGKVTIISSVDGPIRVIVRVKATPKASAKDEWKTSRWAKTWRVS